MFYRTFLIKYGEIGIKGKNRNVFEDALVDQIRRALGRLEGSFRVWKEQGRVIIDVEGEEDRSYSCMGVMVMACKAVKKLLGYELCVMDPEGTLFYSDSRRICKDSR